MFNKNLPNFIITYIKVKQQMQKEEEEEEEEEK
jgi:hypothetical protein